MRARGRIESPRNGACFALDPEIATFCDMPETGDNAIAFGGKIGIYAT